MGKRNYSFFILGLLFGLIFCVGNFLCPQKAKAADTDVVVNEVMAHAPSPQSDYEWIELFNNSLTDSVNLNGWTLNSKIISNAQAVIAPQGFLIFARNSVAFLSINPQVTSPVVQISFGSGLADATGKVILNNSDTSYSDQLSWTTDSGVNTSWERVDSLTDPINFRQSSVSGGTPGQKNSVSNLPKPDSPTLLSPADLEKIISLSQVNFTWQADVTKFKFEFILSTNADLSNPIIDEPNLTALTYTADDLVVGSYYWQVLSTNGVDVALSETRSLEIDPVVYSKDIIINEIYPDPILATENEWFELYNSSAVDVDLKDWLIEDLKGSVHKYKIENSLIVPAKGYIIISKTDSAITLNNDEDGLRLVQPDGNILYETPVFADGDKGWSFARNSSGTWEWTTSITPAHANLITRPVVEDVGGDEATAEIANIPINSEPKDIQTGEYKNYENYLVHISGQVIETSGNTFYLESSTF